MGSYLSSCKQLLRECTVRILVSFGDEGKERGTGFFVSRGKILTCAHVVQGRNFQRSASKIEIFWRIGNREQKFTAQIKVSDSEIDVALLVLDENTIPDHPCVHFDRQEPGLEDTLYSYGYPYNKNQNDSHYLYGVPIRFTHGYEGGTGRDTKEISYWKLKEGQVQPGVSGAPLLNEETFYVSGIVYKTRDRTNDLGGWVVPISIIESRSALKDEEFWQENLQFHQKDNCWQSLIPIPRDVQLNWAGRLSSLFIVVFHLLRFTVFGLWARHSFPKEYVLGLVNSYLHPSQEKTVELLNRSLIKIREEFTDRLRKANSLAEIIGLYSECNLNKNLIAKFGSRKLERRTVETLATLVFIEKEAKKKLKTIEADLSALDRLTLNLWRASEGFQSELKQDYSKIEGFVYELADYSEKSRPNQQEFVNELEHLLDEVQPKISLVRRGLLYKLKELIHYALSITLKLGDIESRLNDIWKLSQTPPGAASGKKPFRDGSDPDIYSPSKLDQIFTLLAQIQNYFISLKQQLVDLQKQSIEQEQQIEYLKSQLTASQQNKEILADKAKSVDDLSLNLRKTEETLKEQKNKIDYLEMEVRRLKSDLSQKSSTNKEKVKELEEANQVKDSLIEDKTAEVETLRSDISKKDSEIQRLKEQGTRYSLPIRGLHTLPTSPLEPSIPDPVPNPENVSGDSISLNLGGVSPSSDQQPVEYPQPPYKVPNSNQVRQGL